MNQDLLDLLACPECGGGDVARLAEDTLACTSCAARYPVVNGIPQMLPARLAASLGQKKAYMERLRASILGEGDVSPTQSPEVDRFMWEHQLYDWAKEVIYNDSRAAEAFSSYAQEGARKLCHFIGERVGGVDGKSLLYVGSGNDLLASLTLERDGAFIISLDLVHDSLDDLRQWGARNCVCGDARYLPFRTGAIDVVFSKGSVHHCHPIAEPLRAMARVVKRGGHIIVAEPSNYVLARVPRLLLPGGLGQPTPHEKAISAGEVTSILRKEGISQLEVATLTHAPPGTPASIAGLWESLGQAMPWLFRRFAFEFMVYGRKM